MPRLGAAIGGLMWIPIAALAGALLGLPLLNLTRTLIASRVEAPCTSPLISEKAVYGWCGLNLTAFAIITSLLLTQGALSVLFALLLFELMLALSAVDLLIRRIPNELLLAMLLVFALYKTASAGWELTSSLLGALAAGAVFILPSKFGLNIGWGDVKYAVILGFCFGLVGLLQIMLVMGVAMVGHLVYLYIRKKGTRKSLAAMGPYISLGAATAMVFPLLETLLNFKI